jgi:RNA polymerase sigma-70 factor (ECF subfamily)
MEDEAIVGLYLSRNEAAIAETAKKYGSYIGRIAYNILGSMPDSEECVNDTYLAAWNSIPPQRPGIFSSYLAKLARRISIDCSRKRSAAKRRGSEVLLSIDELEECLPAGGNIDEEIENERLGGAIGQFLMLLPEERRRMFVLRYFHSYPIRDIARTFEISESKAANILFRVRAELKMYLEREDLFHE